MVFMLQTMEGMVGLELKAQDPSFSDYGMSQVQAQAVAVNV